MTLKFRLKTPTINAWANRLCAQWDLWITNTGGGIDVRFKAADNDVIIANVELSELAMDSPIYRLCSSR